MVSVSAKLPVILNIGVAVLLVPNALVMDVFASTLLILTYLSGLDTTCIPPAFISTKLLSIAISTFVS